MSEEKCQTETTILPDGSAFSTLSFPLPKGHWLYVPGVNVPPMPFRCGTDNPRHHDLAAMVRSAARYAIRASTMNGEDESFDPDAMVQNFVVGMLGYHTPDGLCDYDTDDAWANPDPVPKLFDETFRRINVTEEVKRQNEALHAHIDKLEAAKDEAYHERNQVVAGLAALAVAMGFRAGTARTDIPGWDPEWHGCVYIDLPTGQVSWHYHDRDAHLFDFLLNYHREWDGHDTPEKYRRVLALRDLPPREAAMFSTPTT